MLDEDTSAETESTQTTQTTQNATPDTPPDAGDSSAAAEAPAPRKRAPRKRATKKTAAAAPVGDAGTDGEASGTPPEVTATGEAPPAKKTARRAPRKRAATAPTAETAPEPAAEPAVEATTAPPTADQSTGADTTERPEAPGTEAAQRPAKKAAKRTAKKTTKRAAAVETPEPSADTDGPVEAVPAEDDGTTGSATLPLFQPPPAAAAPGDAADEAVSEESEETDEEQSEPADEAAATTTEQETEQDAEEGEGEGATRRRRRRGGRRRRKGGAGESTDDTTEAAEQGDAGEAQKDEQKSGKSSDKDQGNGPEEQAAEGDSEGGGSTRRRRRRRRSGDGESSEDPENTVTRVRRTRSAEDEITSFSGSTRLEAKKQRRREGREAGRRRAPIISEAEFLARREAVDRTMVIRQRDDLTQIAVLEDKVLVEHYVARESQTSLIGNVYLGRVQNVLPSMEAAFIDIGKGRNAVLYAGEVNWDSLGAKDGHHRKIEQVLKPGQSVLVQVTKDPIGHKGARLTSQVSLPGRFLVYVPDGTTSGISRKLPENERNRLKNLLKEIVPESAGVIVRTAAEGASEDELTRDVQRLTALWEDISSKVENGGSSSAPQLLYGEPDLTLKVVRDLFTEDFGRLVVSGDVAWDMVEGYVQHVAPDLVDRLERHDDSGGDAFAAYRIDEQIAKALDRKVWLPSGGSLIIDRTEAMTVVDVNTGKFTGSGGNLEETVTKNNLEAAEEIVRQLRLRDIGGIIVVDFIDMVLENNRDLVLRRLIECLGRDRTRHQVAEVTSLGLVQMTRKRIGTGLLEAFSEVCECCQGRGLHVRDEPVESRRTPDEEPRRARRNRGRGGKDDDSGSQNGQGSNGNGKSDTDSGPRRPTPAEFAAMARAEAHRAERAEGENEGQAAEEQPPAEGQPGDEQPRTEEQATAGDPGADQSSEQPTDQPTDQATEQTDGQAVEATDRTLPQDAEVPEVGAAAAQADPAVEPSSAVEPEPQEPETPVVPPAPRIVTSVRRVGARRAAGPPVLPRQDEPAQAGGSAQGSGSERDGAEDQPAEEPAHVPVKKKGSRKR